MEPRRLLDTEGLSEQARRLLENQVPTEPMPPALEESLRQRIECIGTDPATAGATTVKLKLMSPTGWSLLLSTLVGVAAGVAWLSGSESQVAVAPSKGDEAYTPSKPIAQMAPPAEPPAARPVAIKRHQTEPAEVVVRLSSENKSKPATQRKRTARRRPRSSGPPPSSTSTTFAEELRLVEAARRRLRRNPTEARVHLREHARRFPRGQLADIRDYLRIRISALEGKQEELRRATQHFEADHPKSALLKEVRALAKGRTGGL